MLASLTAAVDPTCVQAFAMTDTAPRNGRVSAKGYATARKLEAQVVVQIFNSEDNVSPAAL